MLNETEKLLVEAISTMLKHEPQLGLSIHKDVEERSHFAQFKHEQINEMFELETTDLIFQEAVCSAFNKVHSYKYIDDPKFVSAFMKELTWHAIPAKEQAIAEEAYRKVIKKLATENKDKNGNYTEREEGWNPELDEIQEISQPEQFEKS